VAQPPHDERPATDGVGGAASARVPARGGRRGLHMGSDLREERKPRRPAQAAGGRAQAALPGRTKRGAALTCAAQLPYEDRDEDKARAKMSLNFWSLGQINAAECKT